jgi:signal transduction histidine kinase
MKAPLYTISLKQEHDVVLARQRTVQIGAVLGLKQQDLVRMATAVSELARNALGYAGGGKIEFFIDDEEGMVLARVSDKGPGIPHLRAVLDGEYKSPTGLGLGLIGSKRLCDRFEVQTSTQGTTVMVGKVFEAGAFKGEKLHGMVTAKLTQIPLAGPLEVFQQQNQDLLHALAELQARQDDIERLNGELAETNRGVVALYAELEEKAAALSRVSDLKSRFLSNMSHELRTPLSSIRSLTRLLLDRSDGDLTDEQVKQVNYIKATAEGLTEMVNDLLDLAKIEAGKVEVKSKRFGVGELFAALRGMFRPLVESKSVSLSFEFVEGIPWANSDEGKVSQVLRNLISNAIKFTPKGEIRVWAGAEGNDMVFKVRDTGIGIAPEHYEKIFQEYSQVDSPMQRMVKGTGLGLPLSRKMALLLGGSLSVESVAGAGSEFTFRVPLIYAGTDTDDSQKVRHVADDLEVSPCPKMTQKHAS